MHHCSLVAKVGRAKVMMLMMSLITNMNVLCFLNQSSFKVKELRTFSDSVLKANLWTCVCVLSVPVCVCASCSDCSHVSWALRKRAVMLMYDDAICWMSWGMDTVLLLGLEMSEPAGDRIGDIGDELLHTNTHMHRHTHKRTDTHTFFFSAFTKLLAW